MTLGVWWKKAKFSELWNQAKCYRDQSVSNATRIQQRKGQLSLVRRFFPLLANVLFCVENRLDGEIAKGKDIGTE
jgi:hypothetical protein